MTEKRLVVIDGDIVAYRSAAANEKRTVICTHKETAEVVTFDTATKFKEWAGADADNYDIKPHQEAEPIEHAFYSIKNTIKSIVEACDCNAYHVVISGDDNFRLVIPLPTRYKDSRTETARPLQLAECKEYLIRVHKAEISQGVEADDVIVGYKNQGYQKKQYVVSASLDKDDGHGPGYIYDWTKMDKPVLIEGFGSLQVLLRDTGKKTAKGEPKYDKSVKGTGRVFLYYQMLYGDPVDCYKPCELAKVKFGEIGAYDVLKDATTDKEALQLVVNQYRKWYPEPVKYEAWDGLVYTKDWMEIFQMYADCAFMKRFEGDRFVVKNVLDKLGVVYND